MQCSRGNCRYSCVRRVCEGSVEGDGVLVGENVRARERSSDLLVAGESMRSSA